MSSISYNVEQIMNTYFGGDYIIPEKQESETLSRLGTPFEEYRHGVKVFLPITLFCDGERIDLECATISVSGKKNVVTTQMTERKGSIKEVINIDDYKFAINGVLIDHDDCWPDDQMSLLQDMFESSKVVELRCALSDYFLQESKKICIDSLSLYSNGESKEKRHIPFTLTCMSDYIDTLDIT